MAISHPFKYDRIMNRKIVFLVIAVTWILSALLAYGPIFLGWYTTKDHLQMLRDDPTLCTFEVSRTYAFVSSSVSFWIPCTVMVVLYQRILKMAMKQEREIRAMMNQVNRHRDRLDSDNNNTGDSNSTEGASVTNADGEQESSNSTTTDTEQLTPQKKKKQHLKKDYKHMKKMRKEYRAVKTLGIVMGSFIFCMGPLFLWYTITFGICPDTCQLPEEKSWVIAMVFWIGYFNSCMNPVIYAFFNRDFQVAYRRLFSRKLNFIHNKRISATSMTVPPSPLLKRNNSNVNSTHGL